MKPITIALLGGPRHGAVETLPEHARELHVAIPKHPPFSWDLIESPDHLAQFDRCKYTRRVIQIPGTHRRMEYLVLKSLSDEEALDLIAKFEGDIFPTETPSNRNTETPSCKSIY